MAGSSVKTGMVYGETDDFSYNITKDDVHVHDFTRRWFIYLVWTTSGSLIFTKAATSD